MASSVSMSSGISSGQLISGANSGKINGKKIAYAIGTVAVVGAIVVLVAIIIKNSMEKHHVKETCADKTKGKECKEVKIAAAKDVVTKTANIVVNCIPPLNPACITTVGKGYFTEIPVLLGS